MRGALYASGGLHAALIGWVVWGGTLFQEPAEIDFEVTGVTVLSVAEFDALTGQNAPTPVAFDQVAPPDAPTPPTPEVVAPSAEDTAPEPVAPPEPAPAPEPDPVPTPPPPTPQAEVADTVAPLTPPAGSPDLPPSDTPTPREAPRIAPLPAPAQEPDVETSPTVIEQSSAPEASDAPAEETTPAAPEEATTQTVTEADDPAGRPLGPVASVRPTARPQRPTPPAPQAPEEPQPAAAETESDADPLADAIAAAVADAVASPAPATSSAPSGPPLSASVREGFRTAVGNCWNVGSLSNAAQRTTVVVGFDMSREGRPDGSTLRLIEFSGGDDAAAQQAFEAARRAILRCAGNFSLPEESYDRWAQIELVFNPNGMRLR